MNKWTKIEVPVPGGFPKDYRCFEVRDSDGKLVCAASNQNCDIIVAAPAMLNALEAISNDAEKFLTTEDGGDISAEDLLEAIRDTAQSAMPSEGGAQ